MNRSRWPFALEDALAISWRCGEGATQAVCGSGPNPAALMLVGEQPGDEEDLKGRVFVGPAGRLLDLLAIPADERDFSRLGKAGRLASGRTLPPPAAVFPRYVEETEASSQPA